MVEFFRNLWESLIATANTFTWRDALDIILVAYLVYEVIGMMAHTRTGTLVKGINRFAVTFPARAGEYTFNDFVVSIDYR